MYNYYYYHQISLILRVITIFCLKKSIKMPQFIQICLFFITVPSQRISIDSVFYVQMGVSISLMIPVR